MLHSKHVTKVNMVVHACNASLNEAKVGKVP